ncbi:tripartite tricarboxylate transporter substrate-binding protein [Rhodoplanes sp. Z2-YC6860]|uniref:tripartite tricarboxylate transporter substrate-binding protein n=1 Tax=Rhodoplanes sp. Z2-YC6860 TaxID=674703 RepID=UPI0018DDE476|nr:tripartite tricarboxylate transporter substrate-binding protein [Rhodoplanes sp. Z2-YC6860]
MADPLAAEIGGTVVVDNRPGAGGSTGVTGVARAEPDGYTLLIATSAYIVNKALNDQLSYDPVKDFTPICEIANAPNIFVVNANLGVNSLQEFIAFARSQAKGVNYSSPGLGTTPQLSSELLRVRAKISMEHIPYNSGPQAAQAVLTNLVQLSCSAIPLVQPHIEAGTLKPLAVTSATRWRALPDVPTMAESGFDDFVLDTMVMLAGPARLPPAVTARLSDATQAILARPAIRDALQRGGFDVAAKPPAELGARISKEVPMWRDIVAGDGPQAGIDRNGASRQNDKSDERHSPCSMNPRKTTMVFALRLSNPASCLGRSPGSPPSMPKA